MSESSTRFRTSETYREIRDRFDTLRVEEQALFLVEGLLATVGHGINEVGKGVDDLLRDTKAAAERVARDVDAAARRAADDFRDVASSAAAHASDAAERAADAMDDAADDLRKGYHRGTAPVKDAVVESVEDADPTVPPKTTGAVPDPDEPHAPGAPGI